MATKKKLLEAAAGSAAGAGALNVEQVFSTYLYDGNGSSQAIDNGINLGQSFGSGSALFEGASSGDYLTYPSSSDFSFGTGDFTVEAFVNINTSAGNGFIFQISSDSSYFTSTQANQLGIQHFLGDLYYAYNGGFGVGTTSFTVGDWVHVALSRSSGTLKFFVDGVQAASVSDTTNYTGTYLVVGAGYGSQYSTDGYISNFRIVKGTALYTSGFTPPTSELTAVSGTVILTLTGSNPFTDNSSSSHTLTSNGDPKASTFGPFDAASAGEGGMVWIKQRTNAYGHYLYDTERGVQKGIASDSTAVEQTGRTGVTSFNSSGFSLGNFTYENGSGNDIASWTFRKAPKFFDVVEYNSSSGNTTNFGSAGATVDHNLGSVPGMIIVKCTDTAATNWKVYHRGLNGGTNPEQYEIELNQTGVAANSANSWNDTAPTSTQFTLGASGDVNNSSRSYIAYLFAHNNGDGEFGPDADQDIIKCGSYTTNASADATINLGWEPQWVLSRPYDDTSNWKIVDNMRGFLATATASTAYNKELNPNTSGAEVANDQIQITSTGFDHVSGFASKNFIYIAIRRGPMAVPTDAADVFDMYYNSTSGKTNGVYGNIGPVDIIYSKRLNTSAGPYLFDRLRGGSQLLSTPFTNAESQRSPAWHQFDVMVGVQEDYATVYTPGSGNTGIDVFWKRAPSFCDVVAYSGNGTAGRTVSHNLGVVPEMIWVKARNKIDDWPVFHKDVPNTQYLKLNGTNAAITASTVWNNTSPTETDFTVGTYTGINGSSYNYIAYLFASLDGVSKVGSYTGNGSNQTIDCGFSSGARYVVIKRTDSTGDWYVWDTERGIVAGNDPHYRLNEDAAEVTTDDSLDPDNSGFIVNQVSATNINVSSATYVFYAIA